MTTLFSVRGLVLDEILFGCILLVGEALPEEEETRFCQREPKFSTFLLVLVFVFNVVVYHK